MSIWIAFILEVVAIWLVARSLTGIRRRLKGAMSTPPRSRKALFELQALVGRRYLAEAALHALIVTSVSITLVFFCVIAADMMGRSSGDIWAAKRWLVSVRGITSYVSNVLGLASLALGLVALWILTRRAKRQMGADLSGSIRANSERLSASEIAAVRNLILRHEKDPHEAFSGGVWSEVWPDRKVVAARDALDSAWDRFLFLLPANVDRSRVIRPWDASTAEALNGWLATLSNEAIETESAMHAVGETFAHYLDTLSEAYVRIANDPDRIPGEEGARVGLLVSQGLNTYLRRGNRLLYWAGLALLVPAWIGVLGDPALLSKSLSATDLAISRMSGGSQDSQPNPDNPEPEDNLDPKPVNTPLSPRDQTTIRRVTQLLEERAFRDFDPFKPPAGPGGPDGEPRGPRRSPPGESEWIEYEVRSGTARATILHEAADSVNSGGRRRRYEYAVVTDPPPHSEGWLPGSGPGPDDGTPVQTSRPDPVKPGPSGMAIPLTGSEAAREAGSSADARRAEALLRVYEEVAATDGPATRAFRAVEVSLANHFARSPQDLATLHSQWDAVVLPDSPNPIRRQSLKGILVGRLLDLGAQSTIGVHADLGNIVAEMIDASASDYQEQIDASRIRAVISKEAFIRQLRNNSEPEQVLQAVDEGLRSTGDVYSRRVRLLHDRIDLSSVRDNAAAYALESSADVLRQKPPTIARLNDEGVDYATARKVIEEDLQAKLANYAAITKKQPTPAMRALAGEDEAQVLATYDSYFPSQLGVDEKTELGKLKKEYFPDPDAGSMREEGPGGPSSAPPDDDARPFGGSGGGGGFGGGGSGVSTEGGSSGGGGRVATSEPGGLRLNFGEGISSGGWSRFFRARSFSGLRGFTRIGGVLLGRPPRANGDYTDLTWLRTPEGKIVLRLKDAAGNVSESAPYRPELVLLALRYAADGRPTTATMVRAAPIRALKILLHPALLDTAEGHRLIDVDRLTDKYAGSAASEAGSLRIAVTHAVQDQQAVYEVMWAMSALSNSGSSQSSTDLFARWPWLEHDLEFLDAVKRGDIGDRYRTAIRELCDPTLSPYAANTELTHKGLMEQIRKIAIAGTFDSSSIAEAAKSAEVNPNDPEPVQWDPWSGVRERPYGTTPKELLMQKEDDLSDLPMEFMWQVAFDAKDDTRTIEPWESRKLKAVLSHSVADSAVKDQEDREVLRTSREFTYLQRLFRCAFQGHLGVDFPVERLIELQRAVLDCEPQRHPTPRWNGTLADERIAAKLYGVEGPELARRERLYHALNLESTMPQGQTLSAQEQRLLEARLRELTSRWRRSRDTGSSRSGGRRNNRGVITRR
ncbi:MAG: hypothetical protein JST51_11785 [Armatimonadetes bacterium]|nr:hypothetical protein [Armatimonadota bacterium]